MAANCLAVLLPVCAALRNLTAVRIVCFFATRWKDAVRESHARQNPRYELGTVMSVVHMFLFLPSFSQRRLSA